MCPFGTPGASNAAAGPQVAEVVVLHLWSMQQI